MRFINLSHLQSIKTHFTQCESLHGKVYGRVPVWNASCFKRGWEGVGGCAINNSRTSALKVYQCEQKWPYFESAHAKLHTDVTSQRSGVKCRKLATPLLTESYVQEVIRFKMSLWSP